MRVTTRKLTEEQKQLLRKVGHSWAIEHVELDGASPQRVFEMVAARLFLRNHPVDESVRIKFYEQIFGR